MPRQNFLSRESFVDATEKHTRESIMTIPNVLSCIKYLGENRLNESIRFSYLSATKQLVYRIEVMVLPLNEKYTRVSLHASHIDGQVFQTNSDMTVALQDFESAIHAALKGELMHFKPFEPKTNPAKKILQLVGAIKVPAKVYSLQKGMQDSLRKSRQAVTSWRQALVSREQ